MLRPLHVSLKETPVTCVTPNAHDRLQACTGKPQKYLPARATSRQLFACHLPDIVDPFAVEPAREGGGVSVNTPNGCLDLFLVMMLPEALGKKDLSPTSQAPPDAQGISPANGRNLGGHTKLVERLLIDGGPAPIGDLQLGADTQPVDQESSPFVEMCTLPMRSSRGCSGANDGAEQGTDDAG